MGSVTRTMSGASITIMSSRTSTIVPAGTEPISRDVWLPGIGNASADIDTRTGDVLKFDRLAALREAWEDCGSYAVVLRLDHGG